LKLLRGFEDIDELGVSPGSIAHLPTDTGREYRQGHQQGSRRRPNDGPVTASPFANAMENGWPASANRLILQKPLQIGGELAGGGVAVRGTFGHRLEDDRFQLGRNGRVQPLWPGWFIESNLGEQLMAVARGERRPERQKLIEGNAERVDVGAMINADRPGFG